MMVTCSPARVIHQKSIGRRWREGALRVNSLQHHQPVHITFHQSETADFLLPLAKLIQPDRTC